MKELRNVGVCWCDCTYSHLEASQKLDLLRGKFHPVHGYSELTVYWEYKRRWGSKGNLLSSVRDRIRKCRKDSFFEQEVSVCLYSHLDASQELKHLITFPVKSPPSYTLHIRTNFKLDFENLRTWAPMAPICLPLGRIHSLNKMCLFAFTHTWIRPKN